MNRKLYLFIVSMLMIIEIGSLFLTYKSFQNKSNENKDIMLLNNNMFALMIDDGNGNYEESSSSKWPGDNYVYNAEKSGCIDRNGNVLENVLTFDKNTYTALLTTKTSAYCYLYFDVKVQQDTSIEDCEGTLGECLTNNPPKGLNPEEEGGLKRFQGTTADNYICFGTSDKNTCRNNTDAYMYRIIGIDSDNRVKIIKKEALNSAMRWDQEKVANKNWSQSTIYSNINGSSFLNNTTYVPSGWSSKISNTNWKYDNNVTNNISINTTAAGMYAIENSYSTVKSAKIGLMYAHDYYYAYQKDGLNCSGDISWQNGYLCKQSWINVTNNDEGAPTHTQEDGPTFVLEWIMSEISCNTTRCIASGLYEDGYVVENSRDMNGSYAVRPVFFLTNTVKYVSGTGTLADPFIIE